MKLKCYEKILQYYKNKLSTFFNNPDYKISVYPILPNQKLLFPSSDNRACSNELEYIICAKYIGVA